MTHTTGDGRHLSWSKLEFTLLEFDYQATLNHKKCLVRVRMRVPMIRPGHGADSYDVIVDVSYDVIVVRPR